MNTTSNNSSQSKSPSALSIDPGILEMGASVSVNDEMRRSLVAETAEIDTACTKLLSEVKTEEANTAELRKSKAHADMELSGMLQCAKELVETAQMNGQVFRDLQSKVETDITQKPGSNDNSKKDDDAKNHSPTSVVGIQQRSITNKEQVADICQEINHAKAAVCNFEGQRNYLLEEKAIIFDKIKSEHLKVTLANQKHKTHIMEDLLKDKQISRHTQKAACDIVKTRDEKLRETLRAKVSVTSRVLVSIHFGQRPRLSTIKCSQESELKVQKEAFAESEQKMKQAYTALDDEKKASSKLLFDLQQEVDKLEEKIKKLSEPLEEARQLIQQREQAKAQLEQVRGERSLVYSIKMDLQAQISAVQKKMDSIERDKIKEESAAEKIAQLRKANNAFERDVILANLAAKKEQLVELDEFIQAATYPEKESLSRAIIEKKQELAQLKQSIDAAISDKEEKESTLAEYRRIVNDHQDGYQKEFDKMKTLLKEEQDTATALESQIKQQNKTDEYEHGYILRKAKLYKYAAEYLKKIKEKEDKVALMKGK
jgi:DNA repair exonuclease SbcCD ATPase subunit